MGLMDLAQDSVK